MKTMSVSEMESFCGSEGFIGGLCAGIGTASVIFAIGAATNFWNPIGWVSAAFIVADVACIAGSLAD